MIYSSDNNARQLLIVKYLGGSDAEAKYYIKGAGGWRLHGRCLAFVGKNGIGKTREGDTKTPVGELKPLRAFGIMPDPGCALPYLRVTIGTVAVDEEGPYYNRIVHFPENTSADRTPGGEKMWELSPEYDYGIETDYNATCTWPLGSAIFIHCKGAKSWTGGCVALDKQLMRRILQTADSGLRIIVTE